MDYFRIQGGRRLSGRMTVEGSKNASLPLMAAALAPAAAAAQEDGSPLAAPSDRGPQAPNSAAAVRALLAMATPNSPN